ncbi:agmatinase [Desulfohalotomaculum tongense]|uniref:agmatinase n=1 Tax=Desulforadius tongensis TaxID=1216062 RepID=UPI0019564396|nr:agmatinase [Desulforadius tongensis]MBM7855667.1 agmatinase [Desulforadius tongensis]
MLPLVEKCTDFMGSTSNYQEASLVLLGAPMDFTTSFRPGTRQGPQQIRAVSYGLEEYSVYLDKDLADYKYFDAGDVAIPFGHVAESLRRIGETIGQVMDDGKLPLLMGGEHLVSLPAVEQAAKRYDRLALLHFDAHADLREDYLGETYSHATVIRRAIDFVGGENVYQFGIRSGTREEFAFARQHTHMYIDQLLEPLSRVLPELQNRPVYVTLDIDVVDPAYAPGTGTPEPGGCTAGEIIRAVHMLKGLNLVGFDLVEVSPVYDQSERTALLAAKLVREIILQFGSKK